MILIFLTYLALHLAGYFAWFRRLDSLGGEAGTFAYHAVPGCTLALLALVALLLDFSGQTLLAAFLLIGLHGLYSLTFLTLSAWARGGLSADILHSLVEGSGDLSGERMAALEQRVAARWTDRLELFEHGGLVRRADEHLLLSRAGRWAAFILAADQSSAVSGRLLAALRNGPISPEQLDERFEPSSLIEALFDRLLTLGLLKPHEQGLVLTRAGLRVLAAHRTLRGLLVPAPTSRNAVRPNPECRL